MTLLSVSFRRCPMKHVSLSPAFLVLAVLSGLLVVQLSPARGQPQGQQQGQPPNAPAQNQVQQNRGGAPPQVADATPFTSNDGKIKGWKVVIPGNRALATPAVMEG